MGIILLLVAVVFVCWWLMKKSAGIGYVAGQQEADRLQRIRHGDMSLLTPIERMAIENFLLKNNWQTDGDKWWVVGQPGVRCTFENAVWLTKALAESQDT